MTDQPLAPDESTPAGDPSPGERLQKVLAAAGIGSRRACEQLIVDGRVSIDRQVVKELGTRVDPETQEIRLDGELLKIGRRSYYAVNKPRGVVSTTDDPGGRRRVIDLVPAHGERLFTIGRLDLESEGLILVTNDGELANRLAHPRYGVEKTYLAQVAGEPELETLDKLRRGVHLAEGVARAKRVHVRRTIGHSTIIEIVLAEGKNREIRRMLARLGHKVMWLRRIAFGGVKLEDLSPGKWRRLNTDELRTLRNGGVPLHKPGKRSASGHGAQRAGGKSKPPASTSKRPSPAKRTGAFKRPGPPKPTLDAKPKRTVIGEVASAPPRAEKPPQGKRRFSKAAAGKPRFGKSKFGPSTGGKPSGKPGFRGKGRPGGRGRKA